MIGLLQKHGYGLTNTIGTADVIIINTCGFLEASRNESLEIIRHAIASKKTGAKVIVAGCFSQLQGPALEELRPQIHYFLGSGDIESVLAAVDSTEAGASVTNARSYLEQGDVPRTLSTPSHYAYLKIAEGCRKGCSYCIIPHIKGPLKSKPIDQVVHEFSALLSQGVFEIILIAQDLGDYLQDQGFSGSAGLVQLLQRLLRLPQDFRIRLLYLYPDEIDATLIDMMKSDRRILPYLDMPIQHINDDILRAMKRTTTKAQIIRTIEMLRHALPSVGIRTSLIVGFPGESDAQFEELCEFIDTFALDNVGIFAYSREDLSQSATIPGHLPESVKQERCDRLGAVQYRHVQERHKALIGQRIPIIVDGYHPETKLLLVARRPHQCPEVDPVVLLNDFSCVSGFGTTYLAEITDVADYDLVGTAVTPIQREEWI
jgi:ribosomal protein S12 methylthiotransferase